MKKWKFWRKKKFNFFGPSCSFKSFFEKSPHNFQCLLFCCGEFWKVWPLFDIWNKFFLEILKQFLCWIFTNYTKNKKKHSSSLEFITSIWIILYHFTYKYPECFPFFNEIGLRATKDSFRSIFVVFFLVLF